MSKHEIKMIIAVIVVLAAFAVIIPQIPAMLHSLATAVK